MRIIFEVGLEPFFLLNKYGGVILFLVIACLTLSPLAFLYVAMAVSRSFLVHFADQSESEVLLASAEILKVCGQATLYFSLYFPFLMGLISTHMSYRMVEEQVGIQDRHSSLDPSPMPIKRIYQSIQPYTMTLGSEHMDDAGYPTKENSLHKDSCWKIPRAGDTIDDCKRSYRLAPGDCSICMRSLESGERIAWSPNPLCIHVFHSDCILKWMVPWKRSNRSCPVCRQEFMADKCL